MIKEFKEWKILRMKNLINIMIDIININKKIIIDIIVNR
jgi:hypothetical protein